VNTVPYDAFERAEQRYLAALDEMMRYRDALKQIVACDYRGNEPREQQIAREALTPNPPTRSEHSLEGTAVNGPMPVGEEASSR
jgi:hypothetical protein